MKRLYWHIIAIAVITLLAFWLRAANLGALNFYNDEYYHVNTAVGYLKFGEFKQYNFYTEQLEKPYTRASIFTWQVAQSFKWFGVYEQSARLPSLLWGTLLIPVLIILLLCFTKEPLIAYSVGLWITFDNFFVDMSRFTRMYSMMFVLSVLVVFGFYGFTQAKTKSKRYWLAITGMAVLLNVLVFKELTIALIAGLGVYITLRSIIYLVTRNKTERYLFRLWLAGLGVGLALVLLRLAGLNTVPLDALTWGATPQWGYLTDVLSGLRLPTVGGVMLLFGALSIWRYRSAKALVAVLSLTLLIVFVFFSHRYDAKRYIAFIIPFLYVISIAGVTQSLRWIGKKLQWRTKTVFITSIVLLFLIGSKLSFPGVSADGVILQKALADETYSDLKRSNVKSAYKYVADHYETGDTVLIQGPRYYYWPDNTISVRELGYYKSLSLNDFKQLEQSSANGVWVLYSEQRKRHVAPEIRDYVNKNYEKITGLDDTMVNVYYLAP
ncbi:MAG: hypothetical protein WCW27_03340 [Patescibacteria group bacterium]|jgi:hypothetical protein